MPRRLLSGRSPGFARLATALALAVILFGAVVWLRPYLTRRQTSVSEVPAPAALTAGSQFAVLPAQQACMTSVAVEPNSLAAELQLNLAKASPRGGQPVELVLSAPGYRSASHLSGGYPDGIVSLPTTPPPRSLLATACLINRGNTTVLLAASTEARTISRSATTVAGTPVVGDFALTLLDSRRSSLLERLGTVFGHASNLTDHLIPVWLIWILAALVAFGMPIGVLAAFYGALREDEAPAAS